ncbi:MAG: arsenate reductase (glutaredoxin) [Verrucomicrobia subdivision 3 bacterium]|nr:arsenate reductase (glutaredoxin) [Limisphaerales bacterium]
MIIYHNPRCSKSRQALALLRENAVEPEVIEYLKSPPDKPALRNLLQKLDCPGHDLLRTKEAEYAACGLSPESTETEILTAIVANPILLERPIVLNDTRAVIGRPPENVNSLL